MEAARRAESRELRVQNQEESGEGGKWEVRTNVVVTLAYMCVLFILSSIPDTGENGHLVTLVSPTVANILHVPAYGLLALLWIFTLRDQGVTEHQSMCVAFLVASGYGALTELHQVWVPGRFPSALDVISNIAGSLIFISLYWWARKEWRALRLCSGRADNDLDFGFGIADFEFSICQGPNKSEIQIPKFEIRDSKFYVL